MKFNFEKISNNETRAILIIHMDGGYDGRISPINLGLRLNSKDQLETGKLASWARGLTGF